MIVWIDIEFWKECLWLASGVSVLPETISYQSADSSKRVPRVHDTKKETSFPLIVTGGG